MRRKDKEITGIKEITVKMRTGIATPYRLFILTAVFLTFIPSVTSALPEQEHLFVNDFADVIAEQVKEDITRKAADIHVQYDFTQIVVVTVDSLDGLTIEKYANKLFNSWGLGTKRANNGVLFLIVPRGNRGSRLRIEVGIGLERVITDETAGRILDKVLPSYEKGDYSAVAAAGFDMIAERIKKGADVKGVSWWSQGNNGDKVMMVTLDILVPAFIFFLVSIMTLSHLFYKRPSLRKVEKMGIADGGYTMECADIFKKAKNKEKLLWWSSIPVAIIIQTALRNSGMEATENSGLRIVGWIVAGVCAIIAAIVYNKIKYACPKCSAALEYTTIVDEEPTYTNKGRMTVYLACHKCGNKYAGKQSIPKLPEPTDEGDYGLSDVLRRM